MVNSLLNSIVNGVIGLDLFSHNEFLSTAFNCSLALMFLAIPAKITWEIVSAMIRDDDAGMDIHEKIGQYCFRYCDCLFTDCRNYEKLSIQSCRMHQKQF